MERGARELTLRALFGGCVIGAVLAAGNLYMALKTGWWDTGSITAAIIGFVLFHRARGPGATYSPLENNVTQATASAVAAMPAATGLLAAIPALGLMGRSYPMWALAAWGIALGTLGLLFAAPLRRRLIDEEKLPFPSGIATAEVISAMHARGSEAFDRARALFASGALAAVVVVLRDVLRWLPALTELPIALAGPLSLGVSWSPLMFGTGMLLGPRLAASVLAGAAIAWGVIGPLAIHLGAAAPTYDAVRLLLVWPGVTLMVVASLADLALEKRAKLHLSSLLSTAGLDRPLMALALAALAGTVVLGQVVFEIPPAVTAASLLLALVLTVVSSRATGQTDVTPLGPMGQLAQVLLGAATVGAPTVNIAASALTSGEAAETAQGLYAQKAGQTFSASPRRLLLAQLAGVVVGALVSVPVYTLLVSVHGVGTQALPAPSAAVSHALALVISGSAGSALPPLAREAVLVAALVAIVLTALARTRHAAWIPSPVAMGIAFILPAHYVVPIALAAFATALLRRRWPTLVARLIDSVGAGAIAGESLAGVLVAILLATGMLTG